MNTAAAAQDYLRPRSLSEALDSLASGERRILAGGTDLYAGDLAWRAGPVLDIMALSELAQITIGRTLRIGATTTWTTIAEESLPPALHALQVAARQVGRRQIQNAGTIGGNLCNASPAADGVVPLLALDAAVELSAVAGTRCVALADFIVGPRRITLRA
ncbi:MAG: xanthine dehydrogenase family protein subunit M, partial [Acetobacteraceae bacterium]